jgi:hypothetical protein
MKYYRVNSKSKCKSIFVTFGGLFRAKNMDIIFLIDY